MTTEVRLNDVDYCYAVWKLLTDLEKDSFARNQAIRDFREKADRRESHVSALLALVLPLILWGYLLSFSNKAEAGKILDFAGNLASFAARLFGIIMVTVFLFLIVFLLVRSLWTKRVFRSLRDLTERNLKAELLADVEKIDKDVKRIESHSLLSEARIPDKLLSAEILPVLVRYFESGQADTMKEAVYFLNQDLQNTGNYSNLLPKETLLQKEKEYLSDEAGNLERKIRAEGEQR
ncbi:hypothetical protein [Lactovum odontotermitis]